MIDGRHSSCPAGHVYETVDWMKHANCEEGKAGMTDAQQDALKNLCERYHVEFNEDDYTPRFDLPDGYVAGWVGGQKHATYEGGERVRMGTIYVGCDPDGRISS